MADYAVRNSDFGTVIKAISGEDPIKFALYGCWCGRGGGGNEMDATDK